MLASPLRYPGGKARLFEYFAQIIALNGLFRSNYCEPYAGGAGLALRLLSTGFVDRVSLNDLDPSIYSFWRALLEDTDRFCEKIETVPLSIEEWHRQKAIWLEGATGNHLKLGFAAFFLNRTNRSGIIDGAGPIGGYGQIGPWRMDVRFNRKQLITNIKAVGAFSDRISVSNEDALPFVRRKFAEEASFCYLDPPYYVKGSKLYRNAYEHRDHCQIRDLLDENSEAKWVLSYDDAPEIREIYAPRTPVTYSLNYSAGKKGSGNEVVYFSPALQVPVASGFERAAA